MPENKPNGDLNSTCELECASRAKESESARPTDAPGEGESSAEDAPQEAFESPPAPPSLAPPDAAAAFVGESCEPNRKAFTSTAEIMAAARGWCDEHAAMPFGPRTLASQLRRMGGQPHSNGTRRGWRGIKLR